MALRPLAALAALMLTGAPKLLAVAEAIGDHRRQEKMEYILDSRESRMVMRFTDGLMSGFAPNYTFAFTSLEGFVRGTPGSITPATFLMITKADSVRLLDRVSESKRREVEAILKNETMETARYPEIVYRGSDITLEQTGPATCRATIDGTLSQYGTTRRCPIAVDIVMTEATLRMRGSFSIRQSDYGMRTKRFAGGMVRVRDSTDLSFDLVARRKR